MRARVVIPGPMPGQNEIIAAAKSGHGKGNAYSRMKATWGAIVATQARKALQPCAGAVRLICTWVEKDRRRDPDNVTAAVKFVLDGLVAAGIIAGDGWEHVSAIEHNWTVAGKGRGVYSSPGVVVELEEG